MARERREKKYGRLSRSGNTSHAPRVPETPREPGQGPPTREYPPQAADQDRRPSTPLRYDPRYRRPTEDDHATQVHRRPTEDDHATQVHRRPTEDDHPTQVHRRPDGWGDTSTHRYDRAGYDQTSYDRPAYDRPGYDQASYDRPAYDRTPDAPPRRRLTEDDFPTQLHAFDDRPPADAWPDPAVHRGGRPRDAAAAEAAKPATAGEAALVIGKAAVNGTNRAARAVTNRVITASKANGAQESGLTSLIWNQVLSYGTDAMVTVALAGTVFFGASSHAQRGNVLLYLLITMAPFAVIAPVIGPALDRLQHGRRWTMAATGIGRAVLALVMAAHPTDLLVLYPCALGSLVLSKAYGVVRAAAAPRLVPRGMTLTEANARLTIFGLGSTLVLGGLVGALIKITGSYSAGLVLTAVGFAACAFFAVSLPKQVDSAEPAPRHPEEPARPRSQPKVPPMVRLTAWARRGFPPHLVVALQGESALRLLSGLLTIYLAFYVESTAHGLTGVLQLALVIGAAGVGNFLGTAVGTRIRMDRPESVVVISVCVAGGICLLVALAFSPLVAAVGMLLASVGNALCKIALDALIQRDVVETLRSSAFGKSETFLQLAWVVGAALGVVLPSSDGDGPIGFVVAGALVLGAGIVILLRSRAVARHPMTGATAHPDAYGPGGPDGSVVSRSID